MNIVSIPFKGAYYMCIEGSKRAHVLTAANEAFVQGKPDLADAICTEALKLPGCAFAHREEVAKQDDDLDGYYFDSKAYYNLYN